MIAILSDLSDRALVPVISCSLYSTCRQSITAILCVYTGYVTNSHSS